MKTSILLKFYLAKHTESTYIPSFLDEKYIRKNSYTLPENVKVEFKNFKNIQYFFVRNKNYKESEKLLPSVYRKNSDKILPLFFDHFLRKNWECFSDLDFNTFKNIVANSYESTNLNISYKKRAIINSIFKENWLEHFKTIAGTHYVMKRMTKKHIYSSNLEDAIDNLIEYYPEYQSNFNYLMYDLSNQILEYNQDKSPILY